MERADIEEMARAWADDLKDIPATSVMKVYGSLMTRWTSEFPPSVGAFRKAWDAESVYGYQLEYVDKTLELPASYSQKDSPGLTGFVLQRERFEKCGSMVVCNCVGGAGLQDAAVLNNDKEFWVCAGGKCGFRLNVAETMNAPLAEKHKVRDPYQPTMAPEDPYERVMDLLSTKPNPEHSPEQRQGIIDWFKWWKSKYEAPPCWDDLEMYWNQFQEETYG